MRLNKHHLQKNPAQKVAAEKQKEDATKKQKEKTVKNIGMYIFNFCTQIIICI